LAFVRNKSIEVTVPIHVPQRDRITVRIAQALTTVGECPFVIVKQDVVTTPAHNERIQVAVVVQISQRQVPAFAPIR